MKKNRLCRNPLSGAGRLAVTLVVAGLLAVSPNAGAFSQRVSLSVKDANLREVFRSLKEQSGHVITYSEDRLDADHTRVTADFSNLELSEALEVVLGGLPYDFSMGEKAVFIVPAQQPAQQAPAPRKITGRVTTVSGTPLSGVSVMLKGTQRGIATDAQGRFSLPVPAGRHTLQFAFLGFKTQEVPLGPNIQVVDIIMEESAIEAEQVVVTGMFVRAKESYTGSVAEINRTQIQQYRGQNLIRTIANIDPALNLTLDNTYGSDPNRLPDMTIRGNASLPKSLDELNQIGTGQLNAPLVIMNGFPVSMQKLMDFNDDNVESITILKDASATAIYGSRGANGVIVITTRRPTQGDLRVSLRTGLNIEVPDLSSYDLMNASQKLRLEQVAGFYDSDKPLEHNKLQERYNEKLAWIAQGIDTYWLAKPLRTGVGQKYNLDINYGTEVFQVGVNLGYNRIAGVMKGSGRNTFGGSLDLQYNYRSLKFKNQTSVDINSATNSLWGSFAESARMNSYWPTHDAQGNYIPRYLLMSTDPGNWQDTRMWAASPAYNASLNSMDRSGYNTLRNDFRLEWQIMDGLQLMANLGLSSNQNTSDKFVSPRHTRYMELSYQTADNVFRKGEYTYKTGKFNSYETNLQLNYTKNLNGKHLLVAGVNYSMAQTDALDYTIIAEGFTNDDIDYLPAALQYSETQKRPQGNESVTRSVGVTANANYTFDNRYYIDLSYRMDGSSLFGTMNKFAPFWSAGVGWNIHNERFMKDNELFDRLKLRASVGETGSQQFDPYMAQMTLRYDPSQRYITWSGADLMGLGNPQLRWQTTLETNLGAEAEVLDGRLKAMIDIYDKQTEDLLSTMDIARSHGFPNYVANVGRVSNRGFEAGLSGVVMRNSDRNMQWSVNAKLAYNRNRIVELSQAIKDQTALNLEYDEYSKLLFEGHSVDGIYAVPSLGIDPGSGQEIFLDRQGNMVMEKDWKPGYRRYYGSSQPKYRGNAGTYFSYGNLSASLSFAYYWGGKQYNQTLRDKVEVTRSGMEWNVDRRVYDERWLKPGDVTYFKAFSEATTKMSSRFVMDDKVFQLQAVNVTYRWRSPALERAGIELLNISANMSDVFHISSIKRERGTDYPFSRKGGITLQFMF